jgi:CheY-like chemotaxis protein
MCNTQKDEAKGFDKICIFFAEDDEINHYFLQKAFSRYGLNVNGFYNGFDLLSAIKKEKKSKCGIILLDIQMPVMDGITCLSEIKKIRPKVPVIALTAFAMAGDREKYINLGFSEYISKPVTCEHLIEVIQKVNLR